LPLRLFAIVKKRRAHTVVLKGWLMNRANFVNISLQFFRGNFIRQFATSAKAMVTKFVGLFVVVV
jgi:hypothetical protein